MIKKAVAANDNLNIHKVKVFAQGSYANRTNVRADSDVDVCIVCHESKFSGLNDGITLKELGSSPATYKYSSFRNDVACALNDYFGRTAVKQCNKHFDINETSYRVQADVVPCFNYRRYYRRNDNSIYDFLGTAFITLKGDMIVNWPTYNYENGVQKK